MTEWTYNVVVSTEVGSGISEAVQQLSTAQEFAKEQYANIANFLGEDFSKNLIERLVERLISRKQDETKEEEDTPEQVREMLKTLKDMRDAVGLMEEIGKGDLNEIIDSFRKIYDVVKPEDITKSIADVVSIQFANMREEQLKVLRESLDNVGATFIPPNDLPEGLFPALPNMADVQAELDQENLFPIAPIEDKLYDNMIEALRQVILNISPRAGKKVFDEFLEGGAEENKNLKQLKGIMETIVGAKGWVSYFNTSGEFETDLEGQDVANESIKLLTAALSAFFTDDDKLGGGAWMGLGEDLQAGIIKSLEAESNYIFSTPAGAKALQNLVETLVHNTREITANKLNEMFGKDASRITLPDITTTFMSQLKKKTFSDKDIEENNLIPFKEGFGDPFKLASLLTDIMPLIEKSETQASVSNDPEMSIIKLLKDELTGAGLDESFAEAFSSLYDEKFRNDIQQIVDNMRKKGEEVGIIVPQAENIVEDMQRLKTIFATATGITDLTMYEEGGIVVDQNKQELDSEIYFKDAISQQRSNSIELAGMITSGVEVLREDIERSRKFAEDNIEEVLSDTRAIGRIVSGIKPEAGSPTHLNSSGGG